jgi:hypothetical protein
MTATFSKIKSRFANWREWELNPILVKELRQAVRSHILEGMLMVLLLMLFVGSGTALVGESLRAGVTEAGRAVFRSCLAMLAVGGLVFIPIYTGIRLALEKHQDDMMFFTPLRAQNLVQGKALGGVCLAGLFLSVCLPFMAFSSLLRGLDLFTILFTVWLLFVAIGVAILASVAVGAARAPVAGKLVLGAAFAGGLAVSCWKILFFLFEIVQSGIQPLIMNGDFAFKVYVFFVAMTVGSITSYGLSLSFIGKDPRRENPEDNRPHLISSHG